MSPINVAFSTLAFPQSSLAAAAAFGRDSGYEGIELRLIDGELIDAAMSAGARADVRRTLAKAGLPVVAVDSSIRLTGDDPGPALRTFLELASDWESPLVRVFGGALPDDGDARIAAMKTAAGVLEAALPAAERLGVRIGVETHDSFSASATVGELLALVKHDRIGAVWDSHHPHRMGETPAQVYQNLDGRVLLAQVKDALRAPDRADGWQLVLLGEGEVPVREMLATLMGHAYLGSVSVEWEKRWHPEIEAAELALPQHLSLLRTWLDESSEVA
ncbi:MAG TPA: sugar phosphate isomerase/epimerase family protein [Streptosporangiaceae bacterium]|jgi:sugar phosphate isomerase/epimerase|nr:sugar phosphate isomerase/epimerase family protein [Streptosporangiaceae bacterium]